MEPDDLLCSRNARPQKDGKDSLAVLLLAERAQSECARSTRAIEDQPGHPFESEQETAAASLDGLFVHPHRKSFSHRNERMKEQSVHEEGQSGSRTHYDFRLHEGAGPRSVRGDESDRSVS